MTWGGESEKGELKGGISWKMYNKIPPHQHDRSKGGGICFDVLISPDELSKEGNIKDREVFGFVCRLIIETRQTKAGGRARVLFCAPIPPATKTNGQTEQEMKEEKRSRRFWND